MKTAREYTNEMFNCGTCIYNSTEVKNEMIEFARMHVKEALKQAKKMVELDYSSISSIQNIIEKSYPLENIK